MTIFKAFQIFAGVIFIMATHFKAQARPTYWQAQQILESLPAEILIYTEQAPAAYKFESRFDGGESASYTGQVFRQLLVAEQQNYVEQLFTSGGIVSSTEVLTKLWSFMYFDSSTQRQGAINGYHSITLSAFWSNGQLAPLVQETLNKVQAPGSNLVEKIAGNDNALRRGELMGWSSKELADLHLLDVDADRLGDDFIEPDDFIDALYVAMANQLDQPQPSVITAKGIHLGVLLNTFLQGALNLSQASGDYLSTDLGSNKGLFVDFVEPYKGTANYTALEHHWDEGFGYLGAARNLNEYSLEQILAGISTDMDGDGQVDLLSEKNLSPVVQYAAAFDLKIQDLINNGTDVLPYHLTREIFENLVKGRYLVSRADQVNINLLRPYFEAYAARALGAWERALVAEVIGQINTVLVQMNHFGASEYVLETHSKAWTAAKGLALAFQFGQASIVDAATFESIHAHLGDQPVLSAATTSQVEEYKNALIQVRTLLAEKARFGSWVSQL